MSCTFTKNPLYRERKQPRHQEKDKKRVVWQQIGFVSIPTHEFTIRDISEHTHKAKDDELLCRVCKSSVPKSGIEKDTKKRRKHIEPSIPVRSFSIRMDHDQDDMISVFARRDPITGRIIEVKMKPYNRDYDESDYDLDSF